MCGCRVGSKGGIEAVRKDMRKKVQKQIGKIKGVTGSRRQFKWVALGRREEGKKKIQKHANDAADAGVLEIEWWGRRKSQVKANHPPKPAARPYACQRPVCLCS
jgi:hypothetical protein